MKKALRVIGSIVMILLAIVLLFLLVSWIRHIICLEKEKPLLQPLSSQVNVKGHKMSVYSEGEGDYTLVFLSGGGTCSPILDFKSLYSLLSDDYRIVVVEKFGYGFSDDIDESRDLPTLLSETRAALLQAEIAGPYVLCPHSMSGIQALYWAQQYPDEVEAIVGLDMAVPEYYNQMELNLSLIKLGQLGANLGVTRWEPKLADSDAILHGTLTEHEKEIYRALFYKRTATPPMIREVEQVQDNARLVAQEKTPDVPMLLFVSDGSGGTGFEQETWRSIPKDYIKNMPQASIVELDCPHYVHDYEYEKISKEIKAFLQVLLAE